MLTPPKVAPVVENVELASATDRKSKAKSLLDVGAVWLQVIVLGVVAI
jgi:hypothetical protein